MQFTLKQARAYAGLTQAEMAKNLNIDRGTYIKLEKDPSEATVRQLNAIANITGIPLTEIFLGCNSTNVDTLR